MSFMNLTQHAQTGAKAQHRYVVVHPLDDRSERKVDTAKLGPMAMTPSVRLSLLALRGYLILMLCLVGYHCLGLAGLLSKH